MDTGSRLISVILSQHRLQVGGAGGNMVKHWAGSVIRFLRLKGTSPAKIHRQLVEEYGANVMSRKQVWVWCTAFDNGQSQAWVVTALQLGGTGPSSLQPWPGTEWFFISLDYWRSTWVEGDSQPTVKFSKPSCPGFRRLTLISSIRMLGQMPWCTGGTNASASMGIMWENNLYQGRAIDYACIYIIWIQLRNERTCYLIYWTALV
jgi:hypothetical protein